MALWLAPLAYSHRHLACELASLDLQCQGAWSAAQSGPNSPQALSPVAVRKAGATLPSPQTPFPQGYSVTLADPLHCRHILKRREGTSRLSRDRSRGQSCGIKKKQAFLAAGRQKPRLLEADRNDQRTWMDGREEGRVTGKAGREGSWGWGLLHDGLGL